MDWSDLLAIQGTLKSLLQHHSSKSLWHSAFIMAQLSHPYMTTGKIIALTRWTFVGKVMSLLFNVLSRLVITSKEQASFNFMAAVTICSDFGSPQNQVCHCLHCFPIYLPWSDRTKCHDLSLFNVGIKPAFSLSSFTFIKRLFSSSLYAIRMVLSAYLRLLIFLPEILIPVCASSSLAFCIMYSACKLNKVTIYNLDVLLSRFGTSSLFHVKF